MTVQGSPSLAEAYEACRRITAARARSFYLGLRLAPEPERSALYALYAWNRMGDDIVDDTSAPVDARTSRLATFAASTRAIRGGSVGSPDPLWVAMADVLDRFPIEDAWLEAMLRGLTRDLHHEQPQTLDDLGTYCDEVAGSVGCCCVAVWGIRPGTESDASFALAERLGRAFQITNVLRDIGEDARLDPPRCYIPAGLLAEHGISVADLLDWSDPSACRAVVLRLASEAGKAFAAGDELLQRLRPRFRPTLWAMCSVYRRTLGLIESDPTRSVRASHVRPSRAVKLSIACRAFAMSALASERA